MNYSLTLHSTYNRVFFYSLNKAILISKDVVLTGELLAKLELAIKNSK